MKDAQRRTRQHRGTVSVQEAADLLGVTRRTIHRWEAQGRMPPRVVYGRRPQYRRLDICEMIETGQLSPAGSQAGAGAEASASGMPPAAAQHDAD